ncbi:ABC transporter permease subunit [Anaerobranca gottschalkii]|nr:ABC transporter permease subunit [Anaerobranca gottschalkii]
MKVKIVSQQPEQIYGTRHANIATILSLLFMGLGQLYNRQWIKGFSLMIFQIFALIIGFRPMHYALWAITSLGEQPMRDHSLFLMIDAIIIFIIFALFLAIYISNVVDARKTGRLLDMGIPAPGIKQSLNTLKEKGFPLLLLTPGFLLLLFFTAMPLIFAISIGFTNYTASTSPPRHILEWVGFTNFVRVFTLEAWRTTFFQVLGWTLIWTVVSTLSTFLLGLLLAILLNHPKLKFRRLFRTLLILPWAIPGFISILVFRGLFNDQFGHINQMLINLGLGRIPWFTDGFWSRIMVLLVNLWLGFPWFMILCSGVLQSISSEIYDAAEVDGASGFQKFWRITLPLVLYSVAPLLIMSFAHNFNNFNVVYLLTGGGPALVGSRGAGATDILITWVFKITFDELFRYNYASAISLVIFFFVAGVSIWNFRRTRQFQEEDVIS